MSIEKKDVVNGDYYWIKVGSDGPMLATAWRIAGGLTWSTMGRENDWRDKDYIIVLAKIEPPPS